MKRNKTRSRWSDGSSPAPDSSLEPERPTVHFNVLRSLPNVSLMHKWVYGDTPTHPLPVQTISLPRGEYQLEPMVELNMEQFSYAERKFLQLVMEWGVWVIGDGETEYGWPESLVPGLKNWPMEYGKINAIDWRPT